MALSLDSFLVISIDFGTSYTGYCFKFKGRGQIRMPRWGAQHGFNTCKTPTCILFDKKEDFQKFGYDALMTYTKLTAASKARDMFLFENFKMQLYNKEVRRDLMLTARNGKQMRAMKVFSESLKYIKNHTLKKIGEHTRGREFLASDATWVLTVPAIWSAAAKQFMREAATEAGLITKSDSERLIICLEPEAASVYCKQLPTEGFIAEGLDTVDTLQQSPGTKYMVIDCGGGTIDITVHEVLVEGRLKEIHCVSGNSMGGQTVDRNFKSFLQEIFSEELFDEYEREHPSEMQRMMYDFTNYKHYDGDVQIPCPPNLLTLAQKTQDMSAYFKMQHGAEWDEGNITVLRLKLRSFYNDSLSSLKIKIRTILDNLHQDIDYILLVGGFALSQILSGFVKQQFGSNCKVLCPCEAQTAIMQGAVMFGTMPNVIASRISLYTYGVNEYNRFVESKHKGKSKYVNSYGTEYCKVCFHCLVNKDESVPCDDVRSFNNFPVEKNQTAMNFYFYRSDKLNAKFTDELGMEKIGSFSVAMPNTTRDMKRSVMVKVRFGSTEMHATAVDEDSGETASVKLDFMTR